MKATTKILNGLRGARALYSLATLVRDPNRLNEVFEMSDALATPEKMQPVVDAIAKHPDVARSLEVRHRIKVDIAELRKLPEGTLGRVFAEHMVANNLDPSALPTLPSNDPVQYFRAHLYETHDIWHVVTGYHTDLVGELGLQAFYLSQIPGPLPLLLCAVGFLRAAFYDEQLTNAFMDALVAGWSMGRKAKPLFGVRWDDFYATPIEDVREQLGLPREPKAHPIATVQKTTTQPSSLAA